MKTLKYIVFDETYPVIFGEYFAHKEVDNSRKPTSAGQCNVYFDKDKPDQIKVSCYGQSLGLGLKSNPQRDSFLLERMFNDSF